MTEPVKQEPWQVSHKGAAWWADRGEVWTKRAVPYGSFTYWSVVCNSRYVSQSLSEADADRIIADHNIAQERYRDRHYAVNGVPVDVLEAVEQERDSLRNRYVNLVEEMTKILRAVRHSEGEQLSHQEIAARAVGLAQERDAYRELIRAAADILSGKTSLPTLAFMQESNRIAGKLYEVLDRYPAAKAGRE